MQITYKMNKSESNHLPTTKMQNIYLLTNMLKILFTMYDVRCLPTWGHIAQHS